MCEALGNFSSPFGTNGEVAARSPKGKSTTEGSLSDVATNLSPVRDPSVADFGLRPSAAPPPHLSQMGRRS